MATTGDGWEPGFLAGKPAAWIGAGVGAALARDLREAHGGDAEKMASGLRGWGAWICRSGMPKTVWAVIAKTATEVMEAERGAAAECRPGVVSAAA